MKPTLKNVGNNAGGSNKAGVLNVYSGSNLGSVGQKIAKMACYYPKIGQLYVTSGYRPGGGDHHGGLSYGGSATAAVDFGAYDKVGTAEGQRRMRDFAKWLEDKVPGFKNIVELIHTTPYSTDNGYYVRHGSKMGAGGYGSATNAAHVNHVHLAMSNQQVSAALAKLEKTKITITEDDMELSDRIKVGQWLRDNWSDVGKDISVATALGSGYGHARGAKGYAKEARDEATALRAEVKELNAKVDALTVALGLLLPPQ